MLSKTSFDKCFANARCSNYYSVQHGDQSSFISATCAHLTHTAANLREGSGFISPSIICRIKARVCDVLCNVSFLVYVHLCSVCIPCQLLLFCYNCVISSGSMYCFGKKMLNIWHQNHLETGKLQEILLCFWKELKMLRCATFCLPLFLSQRISI